MLPFEIKESFSLNGIQIKLFCFNSEEMEVL